jgi:2-polyprenyl-3-methyl-5-hydroxy-6-metoxy-1,4-benzoquinol methylase
MTRASAINDPAPSPCPICKRTGTVYAQATDIEYFSTTDVFDFCLCSNCDLLYIHPVPSDRLNEIYPANYYSFVAGSKKNVVVRFKEWLDARTFRSLLKLIPGESLRVLDVGGGHGWLASLMRDIDPRVDLTQVVDIDPAAQAGAERNNHRFFCGRIEDFQSVEQYHVILMLNLIEHVSDPASVLRKAKSLLAPTGRIYIKTPNFRALDPRLFRHRNWGGYHCPRHFVIFSRESFRAAASKAGLAIDHFEFTQGAPFWAVSVLELLRQWRLVTVSAERPAIYHPIMPLLQASGALFDFARKPFSRLSQMVVVLSDRVEG